MFFDVYPAFHRSIQAGIQEAKQPHEKSEQLHNNKKQDKNKLLLKTDKQQLKRTVRAVKPWMTRVELKDYLESIYNVPVATIRTRIQHGESSEFMWNNIYISLFQNQITNLFSRIQEKLSSILTGSNKQRDHKNRRIKKPDYKVAYVQLAGGRTFQFPDLFPETEETIEPGSFEDIQKKFMEDERQRQKDDPRQGGVSSWFGL
ncbi:hypothetical protein JD844_021911 [Phrynosoma platyrhinos]|uniref:Large ribosomal subunit protein uL23m n=1 Tax=Phrynosoma platyrhinos TaxID=52577 RepID=A0ABQ7SUG2_PHRPL|nr:hypothetical protein JD844_021911 [Phrynosoma platyrhinos]